MSLPLGVWTSTDFGGTRSWRVINCRALSIKIRISVGGRLGPRHSSDYLPAARLPVRHPVVHLDGYSTCTRSLNETANLHARRLPRLRGFGNSTRLPLTLSGEYYLGPLSLYNKIVRNNSTVVSDQSEDVCKRLNFIEYNGCASHRTNFAAWRSLS